MWELYRSVWVAVVWVVGQSISVSSSEPDNWDGVEAIRYVGMLRTPFGTLDNFGQKSSYSVREREKWVDILYQCG